MFLFEEGIVFKNKDVTQYKKGWLVDENFSYR